MRNQYVNILEEQLSIDYDCTIKDIQSSENVYQIFKVNEKARPIGNADTLLKIAVYNEKLLVMAKPKLLEWCEKSFENQGGLGYRNQKI